jgi:hypothetical protein
MNEFKENVNEQLTELRENWNKQMCEIKKIMQDTIEEFNKNISILKKSNWYLGNEKLNIPSKKSIENPANRKEQVEYKVSALEDKVKELEQLVKGNKKLLRKYKLNM